MQLALQHLILEQHEKKLRWRVVVRQKQWQQCRVFLEKKRWQSAQDLQHSIGLTAVQHLAQHKSLQYSKLRSQLIGMRQRIIRHLMLPEQASKARHAVQVWLRVVTMQAYKPRHHTLPLRQERQQQGRLRTQLVEESKPHNAWLLKNTRVWPQQTKQYAE